MPLLNRIPSIVNDTDPNIITATAADVKMGKVFIDAEGNEVEGTIPDHGAVSDTITENGSYDLPPDGYHNGSGGYVIDVPIKLDTTDATASASEIRSGKTAYVNWKKITGTMPEAALTMNDLQLTSSGLVKASGYVTPSGHVSAETVKKTLQIPTKAAETYKPGVYNQIINKGVYLKGKQTIEGDSNLIAGNIRKGKSIFGVNGSHTTGVQISQANFQSSDNTLLCPCMPEVNTGVLVVLAENYLIEDLDADYYIVFHSFVLYRESTLSNAVNYYLTANVMTNIGNGAWCEFVYSGNGSSFPITLTDEGFSQYQITLSENSSGQLVVGGGTQHTFMNRYLAFVM